MLKIAQIGDSIRWIHPKKKISLQGMVLKCNENSVIVTIINYDKKLFELFPNDRTVVNHKRYSIIHRNQDVS